MVLQLLFLIGNTMFATPLVGLGYEMTSDYNERTRLMAFSNTIGQMAWIIMPWLYVITLIQIHLIRKQKVCVQWLSSWVLCVCIWNITSFIL